MGYAMPRPSPGSGSRAGSRGGRFDRRRGHWNALLRPHEAGILVEDNAASLAEGLVTALSDRQLAGTVAKNARRVAETVLPWEGVARDLLDFYAEQAGEGSLPSLDLPLLNVREEEREMVAR